MNSRRFISFAGGSMIAVGTAAYLLSDRSNVGRMDVELPADNGKILTPDENEILFLASLAPSGHNTQPWFVQYLEPYHWMIGNDKSKWLLAVDPTQRETILSIGSDGDSVRYLPTTSKESKFIDEQTIEANRLQTYRDPAQQELSEWIRFSTKDATPHRDGLTTASKLLTAVMVPAMKDVRDPLPLVRFNLCDKHRS
jgi:hypothetical protein